MNDNQFLSCDIETVRIGEELPVSIYIYADFKFITYRSKGNELTRIDYDKLTQRKVKNLFIKQDDLKVFQEWSNKFKKEEQKEVALLPNIQIAREDAHRKMMDIFLSKHPDKIVAQTIEASKKMVLEVMKTPHVYQKLTGLQTYSKGTVDHSVNVSVLSIYLGMQIGYSHQVILEHLGTGALLHDIGKFQIKIEDGDSEKVIEEKMKDHPRVGRILLEKEGKLSEEVLNIVSQHHECHDGSGYPNRLKSTQIYDLARIVSIANVFDELVGSGKGTLQERQKYAMKKMENELYRKFDPIKLEKCLRVLKLGI
jgi:putative nucleotidyltransferase with HDIG domain